MIVLVDGVRYRLIRTDTEHLLERTIRNNNVHIFGSDCLYFDLKARVQSRAGVISIPDSYIIFFDPSPKWCILEVELASHPIYDHLIPQLTKFKRGIEDSSTRKKLIEIFYETVSGDEVLKARLKQKIGSGEIYKFISDLICQDPLIIVVIDQRTDELDEALKDIRNVRVLEFKTFRREGVSDPINAYVFDELVPAKTEQAEGAKVALEPSKPVIGKSILPAGLKLRNVYKGKEFVAEVVEGGRINFNGKLYDTVSAAAVAAIQMRGSDRRTEDGWQWWRFQDPQTGEEKRIDVLRKK